MRPRSHKRSFWTYPSPVYLTLLPKCARSAPHKRLLSEALFWRLPDGTSRCLLFVNANNVETVTFWAVGLYLTFSREVEALSRGHLGRLPSRAYKS